MYEVFEQLLQKNGVTPYKVAKEAGVTQTALSNWKSGRSTPTTKTLRKIADYFGVTIDYLMNGEEKKERTLTPKDERDLKRDLDRIMEEIRKKDNGPLYYNGVEISDASTNLLQNAIEFALKETKMENKEKYNPYKNKSR